MTSFHSDKKSIRSSDVRIFDFLSDFNNFGKLMPEQVVNWQSTRDNCSFTIKGMADLALRMEKKEEFSLVVYASEGKSPLPLQMSFQISRVDEEQCEVVCSLEAKLNPMVKMMASRPLQNLVNLLVEKLKEITEL